MASSAGDTTLADINEDVTNSSTSNQQAAVHDTARQPLSGEIATVDAHPKKSTGWRKGECSVDYFDPKGVRLLSRALSRQDAESGSASVEHSSPISNNEPPTLQDDREKPIDFREVLAEYLKRYVFMSIELTFSQL